MTCKGSLIILVQSCKEVLIINFARMLYFWNREIEIDR